MSQKISQLAKQYREIEAKHEEQSARLKELSAEWQAIENKLLEAFVEEGVNSVKLEGLGNFILNTKNYLSVTAGNKEQYFEYLKASGNDGLLKLDVNPKTNGAFLDTHLLTLMSEYAAEGLNQIEARMKALEFLKQKGVSYFSEKRISVRKA